MRGLQWPGLTAFLVQFALGLCDPIPLFSDGEAKNPVAYLYNGVRLPALPEWDREKYPYAMIFRNADGSCTLRCHTENAEYHIVKDSVYFGTLVLKPYPHLMSIYIDEYTGWDEFEEYSYGAWAIDNSKSEEYTLQWTNIDLKYNGTLYLAASEPVPVYE